ncbi:MAG: flagellar biosynthesis protein FliQ [Treponemataceae bacterium]
MSLGVIISLMREGIMMVFILATPVLLVALLVGLIVAILQATTSIQEQTLTFVPKVFAILAVLALLGGWMFSLMGNYTINLFSMISQM